MPSRFHRLWILGLALLLSTGFLFWGDPGSSVTRSIHHFWNTGHIIYFALLTYLLLSTKTMARQSLAMQWIITLSLTLIGGALIEVSQYGSSRTPDTEDILRDMTGSLLVLSFATVKPQSRIFHWLLSCLKVTLVITLLVYLKPLIISLLDEGIARYQFPVLANFETPFEMGRWVGDAKRSREGSEASDDVALMRVDLATQRYSGAYLEYFPGDWRDYRLLRLILFNPGSQMLNLTCRIHDAQHALGQQQHADRFNQTYKVLPGLNEIKIELKTVAASPEKRSMDLSRIRGLGIFVSALKSPRTLYIQEVRLE